VGLLEEGLRAFGAWEPLAHRVRHGSDGGAREAYDWEHTEEFIRGLRDRGFNLFITHFSKGYGIEAEAEERENTRRVVNLCHKYGMYAGGYVRYTTFIPDTFLKEDPGCLERFASRMADGGYAHYGSQYWRYMPCPLSDDYLAYFDRLIEIGVGEMGLDCLHVDGMTMPFGPYTCRCERCAAAFRRWLEGRFPTAAEQKARLGFAGFEHVLPPDFNVYFEPRYPLPVATDPLAQEWMLFECSLLARVWRFITESAHRRNPACVVQGNGCFYPDSNMAWYGAMHIGQMAEAGSEGFFTEEGNAPNLTDDGRLSGYFESFKKLRRLGKVIFTYNREPVTHKPMSEPERLKRGMAHQMAFNRDSAGVFCSELAPGKWPATVQEYMDFHRARRDLFRGAEQAHDVAVYASERTRTFNCGTPVATSLLATDALMRGHAPFGFLLETRRQDAGEFRALVLPEVECMSQEEAADLARYVDQGGGLLVIGANTGRYDELRRRHARNPLAEKLGVTWDEASSAFAARSGRGRVAFLPALLSPDGTVAELVEKSMAKTKPHFLLRNLEWRPPLNAAEMLSLLRWAAGGFRFEVVAPDSVVVEFVRQPERNRWLIHLVNFDLKKDVGPLEIVCRGVEVCRAAAFTPDGAAPRVEMAPAADGGHAVRVEGFHRYLILSVE